MRRGPNLILSVRSPVSDSLLPVTNGALASAETLDVWTIFDDACLGLALSCNGDNFRPSIDVELVPDSVVKGMDYR